MKKVLLVIFTIMLALPFLLTLIHMSTAIGDKYALIVNTWNDFPKENAYNVDAFPAQAIQAYYTLKKLGYSDDKIVLMVYHMGDGFIDVDGDEDNDLEGAGVDVENKDVNKSRLMFELYKLGSTLSIDDTLIIYLVGHGGYYTNETSCLTFENGENLSEQEFSEWLAPIQCKRVYVLADLCYSGNFISSLRKQGRVLIASAADNKEGRFYWGWAHNLSDVDRTIFGNSGSTFFHPFWNKLSQDGNFQEAYEYARQQCRHWGDIDSNAKNTTENQNPEMLILERTLFEEFLRHFPGKEMGFYSYILLLILIIIMASRARVDSP